MTSNTNLIEKKRELVLVFVIDKQFLFYIIHSPCSVIEERKHLRKSEDPVPLQRWIFRNDQPGCDDNRIIFVTQTSSYEHLSNLCVSSWGLYRKSLCTLSTALEIIMSCVCRRILFLNLPPLSNSRRRSRSFARQSGRSYAYLISINLYIWKYTTLLIEFEIVMYLTIV